MESKKDRNKKSLVNDRYNSETPQEIDFERKEAMKNGEEEDGYAPRDYTEIYNEGKAFLKDKGYEIVARSGGAYCDHDIYRETTVTNYSAAGYNPDSKTKVWVRIDEEDFFKVKDLLVEFINGSSSVKTAATVWGVIFSPTGEKRKPIYDLARRELLIKNNKEIKEGNYRTNISLTATTLNKEYPTRKWIPQKGWFDERLHSVEIKDLITILPEAEREMLALCIGRALIGENGSTTSDGVNIEHTFRTIAIMVGKDAGLGKSTLMDYIFGAAKECGYDVANLQNSSSRFGWAKIIKADFAYNDDLTPSTQKKLITSDHIKSIVSSGEITTEEKGVDASIQKSRCTLFANSNDYSKADFYKMDSGMQSRVKLLATHSGLTLDKLVKELSGVSEGSNSLRTEEHWNHLVNKLDTTPRVLALWFLHLCAQRFMEAIGLTLNPTEGLHAHPVRPEKITTLKPEYLTETEDGVKLNTLFIRVKELSEELQIQIDRNCTRDFIYFWRFLWANSMRYDNMKNNRRLRKLSKEEADEVVAELRLRIPTVNDLKDLLAAFCGSIDLLTGDSDLKNLLLKDKKENCTPGQYHVYDFFDSMMMDSTFFLKANNQIVGDDANAVSVPDIFKNTFHHFTSKDGFRLTGSYTLIVDLWEQSAELDTLFRETHDRLEGEAPYRAIEMIIERVYDL